MEYTRTQDIAREVHLGPDQSKLAEVLKVMGVNGFSAGSLTGLNEPELSKLEALYKCCVTIRAVFMYAKYEPRDGVDPIEVFRHTWPEYQALDERLQAQWRQAAGLAWLIHSQIGGGEHLLSLPRKQIVLPVAALECSEAEDQFRNYVVSTRSRVFRASAMDGSGLANFLQRIAWTPTARPDLKASISELRIMVWKPEARTFPRHTYESLCSNLDKILLLEWEDAAQSNHSTRPLMISETEVTPYTLAWHYADQACWREFRLQGTEGIHVGDWTRLNRFPEQMYDGVKAHLDPLGQSKLPLWKDVRDDFIRRVRANPCTCAMRDCPWK